MAFNDREQKASALLLRVYILTPSASGDPCGSWQLHWGWLVCSGPFSGLGGQRWLALGCLSSLLLQMGSRPQGGQGCSCGLRHSKTVSRTERYTAPLHATASFMLYLLIKGSHKATGLIRRRDYVLSDGITREHWIRTAGGVATL